MYKIIFHHSKNFKKDIKQLRKSGEIKRVEEKMIQLAQYPGLENLDIKKLKESEASTFRLRVGNWRVFYDVDTFNNTIIIYRILHRKNAY